MDLATHQGPFVSVAELAAYWGVSERTIYRDIDKGALHVMHVGSSGVIRVPIGEARRYGRPADAPPMFPHRPL